MMMFFVLLFYGCGCALIGFWIAAVLAQSGRLSAEEELDELRRRWPS